MREIAFLLLKIFCQGFHTDARIESCTFLLLFAKFSAINPRTSETFLVQMLYILAWMLYYNTLFAHVNLSLKNSIFKCSYISFLKYSELKAYFFECSNNGLFPLFLCNISAIELRFPSNEKVYAFLSPKSTADHKEKLRKEEILLI